MATIKTYRPRSYALLNRGKSLPNSRISRTAPCNDQSLRHQSLHVGAEGLNPVISNMASGTGRYFCSVILFLASLAFDQ